MPTPPILRVPDAADRIRQANRESGRRIVLLDDDPTGSQTVHDVDVVFAPARAEYVSALAEPGAECFVLTNSRSLDESDAVSLDAAVLDDVYSVAADYNAPVSIVSRSDSTLRGHVVAESRELADAAARAGRPLDAVLFVPAFFEAGRFTENDVHYARVGSDVLPVGETEFAQDATFGFSSSNLRDFLEEKSSRAVRARDIAGLSLEDIREGGPDRVAEILTATAQAQFVVVNATCYEDLEVVVLGVLEAERRGTTIGFRAGPSLARPLAGLTAKDPLTSNDIDVDSGRHGLVVVGSHVGLTSRQIAAACARHDLGEVELDAARLAESQPDDYIAEAAAHVRDLLSASDVLIYTSRDVIRGTDEADSLRIARNISNGVNAVVHHAMSARPGWVIAKGGITSHEVAVTGLGIRRARVLGQLFAGTVSVMKPTAADEAALDIPYVVFPGNVGDENGLADAISVLHNT